VRTQIEFKPDLRGSERLFIHAALLSLPVLKQFIVPDFRHLVAGEPAHRTRLCLPALGATARRLRST
jgi:hypothetical protein